MPLHQRLRWTAWTILLAGLAVGGALYALAADDGDADGDMSDGPGYDLTIERIGGKAALFTARFHHWLASLAHGRPLAITIGVLAVTVALACFWFAGLVTRQDDAPRQEPRR